jgi:hypothetical protein
MPDDPNIGPENDTPDIDAEDWEIAFEPFKTNPSAALSLGFRFMTLKEYLTSAPPKVKEAIEAIDLAVDVIFQYSDFHSVSRELFRRMIQGQLTVEEEEKLRALGIKV